MKPEDRGCLNKRRFATEVEAVAAAAAITAHKERHGNKWPMYVYRCKYCSQWHTTKRRPLDAGR